MEKEVPLKIEIFSRVDNENYRLTSAKEIEFVLHHIAERGARVALYYGNANEFILTTVLEVNDQGLWLEQSRNSTESRRIAQSRKLVLVSSHLQVKVQFTAHQVSEVLYQNFPAFYLPLPENIYRLQRREYYRLITPVIDPLCCVIAAGKLQKNQPREFSIMDISGGGVALTCAETDTELVLGQKYPNCRIELPEFGEISGTIEVRTLVLLTSVTGQIRKRAGCQFSDLDSQSILLLQRYVTNMQREKSKL